MDDLTPNYSSPEFKRSAVAPLFRFAYNLINGGRRWGLANIIFKFLYRLEGGPGHSGTVRELLWKNNHVEGAWQTASGRGRPSWISADGGEMSARVISLPVRDDIDRLINEQLIVELYSK